MTKNELPTLGDLLTELDRDPDFRREYRRQKPYYDLLLEIVRLRKQLNLTQSELAKRASTHQSRISRIESGEHNIRIGTLIEIAEALEAQVEIRLVPIRHDLEGEDYVDELVVRVPRPLHKRLARRAEQENSSLSQLIVVLLSERMERWSERKKDVRARYEAEHKPLQPEHFQALRSFILKRYRSRPQQPASHTPWKFSSFKTELVPEGIYGTRRTHQ